MLGVQWCVGREAYIQGGVHHGGWGGICNRVYLRVVVRRYM